MAPRDCAVMKTAGRGLARKFPQNLAQNFLEQTQIIGVNWRDNYPRIYLIMGNLAVKPGDFRT